MNISLDKMLPKWNAFLRRVETSWRAFLFMSARFWGAAVIVFIVMGIIMLLVDGWVFWQFAYAPEYDSPEMDEGRFTLKRKELDAALQLLRERKVGLLQGNETTVPVREVFGLPPAPSQ